MRQPALFDHSRRVGFASRAAAKVVPPLVLLVVVLAAWQSFVMTSDVPTVILPSPVEVGVATVERLPTLFGDAVVTAATAGLGLFGGLVVGLALAFIMVGSRTAAVVVQPYVIGFRIAPLIAIAPLVFLWFGYGIATRALLVATMTLFPVAIASLDGLRATPQSYLDLARSVDAPPRRVFLRVQVPAAAPSVVAGVKLAAALSVVGAVVAEFLTLRNGIGYRLFVTASNLETAGSFAALFVLSLLGLAFYLLPVVVEQIAVWELD